MNRKYIDFVPAKKKPTAKQPVARAPEKKAVSRPVSRVSAPKAPIKRAVVSRPATHKVEPLREKKSENVAAPKPKTAARLGVIEDLNSNFVKAEVAKRPLGQNKAAEVALKEAKAEKVLSKPKASAAKPAPKPESRVEGTFKTPSTPFINQEKVVKRPLSKNVYAKSAVKEAAEKPEPKGPVTIISKPEKDAHVSVVVTIIITIILGAAAGTVAFLLLPK